MGQLEWTASKWFGLTIAAQAAKLLGAELMVESEVGRGSTFRLSLPALD